MSSAGLLAIDECADQVALLFQRLDERQRRWVGGLLASMLPHGGIGKVASVAGLGDCRNNPARACQPCAAKI